MYNILNKYDVIIVGGGHAGIEAANATANMNQKTLLITNNKLSIGIMHCNPSIGGVGKGQLVKEIDALGGLMGKAIDLAGIQFKILNYNKGEAVRSTRIQADRLLYPKIIYKLLPKENLTILEDLVTKLLIKNNIIKGVFTKNNNYIYSNSVIITVGTFLHSKIYIGKKIFYNKKRSFNELSKYIKYNLPLKSYRFKTGTPPRLKRNTINFNILKKQLGDNPVPFFSFDNINKNIFLKQIPTYITYTNLKTHNIIKQNLKNSPLYNGNIKGIGPRYCPSIEDKVMIFNKRDRHTIFLEIEGINSNIVYPNGISTSLPENIQKKIIYSIKGLENCKIINFGYAIEYDCFDPRDLFLTCESKFIKRLFFAGQINGTTGYEEAAAQGLIAGINAALINKNLDTWYPKRSEAYIGVLMDDLCNLGITEPYRMFTTRAEYRLLLRENNSDIRLTPIGYKLGLINNKRWKNFNFKKKIIKNIKNKFIDTYININKYNFNKKFLLKIFNQEILKKINNKYINLNKILLISNLNINKFLFFIKKIVKFKESIYFIKEVFIELKYKGYIKQLFENLNRNIDLDKIYFNKNIDFNKINNLSNEAKSKLNLYKPLTLGQASRISGITYNNITMLLIYLKNIK